MDAHTAPGDAIDVESTAARWFDQAQLNRQLNLTGGPGRAEPGRRLGDLHGLTAPVATVVRATTTSSLAAEMTGCKAALGDDQIDGMGGNDVREGGAGKDNIQSDGIIKAGFTNTVAAQYHASSGNAMNHF